MSVPEVRKPLNQEEWVSQTRTATAGNSIHLSTTVNFLKAYMSRNGPHPHSIQL